MVQGPWFCWIFHDQKDAEDAIQKSAIKTLKVKLSSGMILP